MVVLLCYLAPIVSGQQPGNCAQQGSGNLGCFDITAQSVCTTVTNEAPLGDQRWWLAGLDLNIDFVIKCGEIAAYQVKWSTGWSDWYVPGVNDMDQKVNTNNGLRRMWSYFDDHYHTYIICKSNAYKSKCC
ncbi:unnamed protein product [Didymodactylos carnosus]|uniref:Uncharacterized protein n=1 Tax=Didymodactylos carnosus TaxID=1234261 RepID=A0A8S2UGR6_9BILA|nr:unnamed protein product [Didymodactylos carnosus]CAF4342838.1 unnamed protein product [Didymodactylos carnosus]